MKLFFSDTFELPLPEKHRFPMAKYTRLRERAEAASEEFGFELKIAPAATDDELLLVHTPEYLNKVKTGELSELEIRRIGFPWSPKMVERSRRSTGASIAAARSALEFGVGGNLAGGTHHSFADSGQGYCVFNDVCVAARVLQQESLIRNVLVIDCDVHQGNGTAAITKEDPSLFSFSMHCEKNYPFKKTAGDLDVALPEKTGDQEYLEALTNSLEQVLEKFTPDFVFYLAGADPYENDRLGLLGLSKTGLGQRDEMVMDFCCANDLPLSIAMAGGYAPDLNDIVDIHFHTLKVAAKAFRSKNNGEYPVENCPQSNLFNKEI